MDHDCFLIFPSHMNIWFFDDDDKDKVHVPTFVNAIHSYNCWFCDKIKIG